jgi:hypothetical protein
MVIDHQKLSLRVAVDLREQCPERSPRVAKVKGDVDCHHQVIARKISIRESGLPKAIVSGFGRYDYSDVMETPGREIGPRLLCG